MALSTSNAPGFNAARRAVEVGRAAFFGSVSSDLPAGRSPEIEANDLVPQFGFVGPGFASSRILLLGINPGNGPNDVETSADAAMLPALRAFFARPSLENFLKAQDAYRSVCESWAIWGNHCAAILGAANLAAGDIAYSNCLPWRTASKAAFSTRVAERTASLYAGPLVMELAPSVIIAAGKKAMSVLELAQIELPRVIVWNRAQALTPAVAKEREAALEQLRSVLATRNGTE